MHNASIHRLTIKHLLFASLLVVSTATCGDDPVDLIAACNVSSDSLDMGTVFLGDAAERSFTVTASGTAELDGSVSLSSGGACDQFSIVEGAGAFSLKPGTSRRVTVRFAPTSFGRENCVIDVGTTECSTVSISGRGDGPAECHLDTLALDFGRAFAGDPPKQESFFITNTGGDTLSGTVEILGGDTCDTFVITSGHGPYSLTAGKSQEVTVSFDANTSVSGLKRCVVGTGCGDVELTGERFPGWVPGLSGPWPDRPGELIVVTDVAFGSRDIWLAVGFAGDTGIGGDYFVPNEGLIFGSVRSYDASWLDPIPPYDVGIGPEGIAMSGRQGIIVGHLGEVRTIEVIDDLEYPLWIVERAKVTSKTLRDVSMIGIQNAMAVGDSGTVIVSTDGGASWTLKSAGNPHLNGVEMLADNVAIAVGESGTVVRTSDRGDTWAGLSVAGVNFYGIDFIDANTGTIVGHAGSVYRTADAGDSWTKQDIPTSVDLYDVCFADAENGVVVGEVGFDGSIWRTFDAGQTWVEEYHPTPSSSMFGVTLLSPTMGMITGVETLLKLE